MSNFKTKTGKFESEAAMCAAFVAGLPGDWQAYAETGGWDILLVRKDGCQVGVQAKLLLNADVLVQAAEHYSWNSTGPGPDYRAALVPSYANTRLAALSAYCSLTILTMDPRNHRFWPALPPLGSAYCSDDWHEMLPHLRHPVPEYVPDVAAGSPAPVQLTQWKIKAMKLSARLHDSGYLTRADFKEFGLDIRRWLPAWLAASEQGFVATEHFPKWERRHPDVWAQIQAEPQKWKRRVPA